jgi:folate-dependent tRNA-U54 methylase TrmFO/GidA
MKANFGILPELNQKIKGKRERAAAFAERSKSEVRLFQISHPELYNKGYCA